MTHQSSVEMLAEVDAIREEVRGEIAAASERAVAHAEVEEIQRAIATIDVRLEWLAPHVAEAEELKAERAELEAKLRR